MKMMRVILKNGQSVDLDDSQGQRMLYAMTTISTTPISEHHNIERLEDGAGVIHWPPEAISHAQKSQDEAG